MCTRRCILADARVCVKISLHRRRRRRRVQVWAQVRAHITICICSYEEKPTLFPPGHLSRSKYTYRYAEFTCQVIFFFLFILLLSTYDICTRCLFLRARVLFEQRKFFLLISIRCYFIQAIYVRMIEREKKKTQRICTLVLSIRTHLHRVPVFFFFPHTFFYPKRVKRTTSIRELC